MKTSPRSLIPMTFPSRSFICVCVLTVLPGVAPAQAVRSPAQMKGLSLDQLLATKVISMSRTLEDWQTAPTAISLLNASDIERSGAVRLADVLRRAPGLSVSRYFGSSYSIESRGFGTASVNKMLVLMDGRSLYTPLFSGVFWEVQDTSLLDLDRIEVVRGPGATLWGANAMNGVINIVSKDARDTQGTLIIAGAGNEEQAFATVRYGAPVSDHAWYRAYVKYVARDEQTLSSGIRAGDDMAQTQTGFRYDAAPGTGGHFTLQGDGYWNSFGTLGRPDADNSGGNLLARWTQYRADNSELTVQAYYDRAARDVPRQFSETRNTIDLDVQWHVQPRARHDVVAGFGYRNSWDRTGTEADRTFVFSPARRRIELVTGFVQDQITLEPLRWNLYVGSKFEHNDFTGTEVQPAVRLAFTPDGQQTVWGAVSRAVRTPTRVDTDSRFLPAPATGVVFIRGNPDFGAETALAYELGYRVQPHPALFLDLATYYNVYDDLRTLEPTPTTVLPLILGNGRRGETYGAELVATAQPTQWWRLRGSVAYIHENLRLQPGSRDTTGGTLEANDPSTIASLESTLNLPGGFQFDCFVHGATARPNPALAGYTAVDARLGWQSTRGWELALIGQNLFSPRHPEFVGGGSQPEVERSVYLRFTSRF